MTRRAFLSALAAVPLLRYLEPLARWIAPAPVIEPNPLFTGSFGFWDDVIFYEGDSYLSALSKMETAYRHNVEKVVKGLGYGSLGLDSKPPERAR